MLIERPEAAVTMKKYCLQMYTIFVSLKNGIGKKTDSHTRKPE